MSSVSWLCICGECHTMRCKSETRAYWYARYIVAFGAIDIEVSPAGVEALDCSRGLGEPAPVATRLLGEWQNF